MSYRGLSVDMIPFREETRINSGFDFRHATARGTEFISQGLSFTYKTHTEPMSGLFMLAFTCKYQGFRLVLKLYQLEELAKASNHTIINAVWMLARLGYKPNQFPKKAFLDSVAKLDEGAPAEKLSFVDNMTPLAVLSVAAAHYDPKVKSQLPPAAMLASIIETTDPFWTAIAHCDILNFIERANSIGMIICSESVSFDSFKFFVRRLTNYRGVISRPKDYLRPPDIADIEFIVVKQIFEQYSDIEIMQWYEYYDKFDNRPNLIKRVFDASDIDNLVWDIRRYRFATNGKVSDIVDLEPRCSYKYQHSKSQYMIPYVVDAETIMISYGRARHYRMWTLDELLLCVNVEQGVVNVPDGHNQYDDHDLGLGTTFTIEQLRDLVYYIDDVLDLIPRLGQLQSKIADVIDVNSRTEMWTRQMQDEYRSLSELDQRHVGAYICFLTVLVPWIRFWKGPGHPIPYKWLGDHYKDPSQHGDYNSVDERDLVVTQEMAWRKKFLDHISSTALSYIRKLPLACKRSGKHRIAIQEDQYFGTPETTIEHQIRRMAADELCIAQTSDLLYQSTPFYFTLINRDPIAAIEAYTMVRYKVAVTIDPSQFDFSRNIQDDFVYDDGGDGPGPGMAASSSGLVQALGQTTGHVPLELIQALINIGII